MHILKVLFIVMSPVDAVGDHNRRKLKHTSHELVMIVTWCLVTCRSILESLVCDNDENPRR